jgi:hypothetical protein
MLANAQPAGIDVLGRLAEIAAMRAAGGVGRPIALTGCDQAGIDPRLARQDCRFEAWLVRESDRAAIVAAFATIRGPGGHDRIAASGRFTFSLLPIEKDPRP